MIRRSRWAAFTGRRAIVVELTALAGAGLAFLVFAIRGDWYESLHDAVKRHEGFSLDEIVLAVLVVTVLFSLLSVRRWSGLARRESERDIALRALREERDFSTTVVDSVSSLVLVLDRDGRIIRFNRACEAVSGFSADEVASRPFWEVLIPAAQADTRRDDFRRFVAQGGSMRGEMSWIARDGSAHLIAWTQTAVPDDRGVPRYVVATGRDVTDERRSQEALRRTEERLEGILLSIDDFVWSQDAETREMLYVSPSVERIYGVKPETMRANTRIWMEVIHPDDRERVASYLPSLLSAGRAAAEYRIVRDDGSIRWVHDRAWAIRDADGRRIRFDGIVRDITDQKHLESQFRQSQKMEAVGLLAGGIAHDFNNLLTAIGGYADLMLGRLHPGDPSREQAEAIQRAAARAASLTRQLLAFSRRQVLQPRVLDLNELVGAMEPLVQRLVGEDVEVVLRRSPALGPVRVDAGQMEQVLMNLVVNARDAMPEGGRMTIRTEHVELAPRADDDDRPRAGSYVALSVSDTGSGMDETVRARIFEPFFTTKPVGKGTGLGLSTVYGIVEQSGGHVEVETAEGAGTTFRVLLPRHLGAAIPDGPELVAPPRATHASTLLLVEDEPSVRELACEVLEADGFEVLCASDGREALATARRHADRIRLVITDVVMPQMGGLELVDALGDVLPTASVLFMSGYSESVVRGEARFSAGAGFLQKPFTPADLLRHAREALDRAGRSRA